METEDYTFTGSNEAYAALYILQRNKRLGDLGIAASELVSPAVLRISYKPDDAVVVMAFMIGLIEGIERLAINPSHMFQIIKGIMSKGEASALLEATYMEVKNA